MAELPIIIAGGGIAGLAAACALAKTGAGIIVCERAAKFETAGAGLQAGPNAVRALKAIGAWDAFEPSTYAPPAIVMRDGVSGQTLKRINLGKGFEATFGEPYRVAHRAHLHAALGQVARSHGNVACELGSEVLGYAHEDGAVVIQSAGGQRKARFLIGADGLHSKVRCAMLKDGPPVHHGGTLHRALVPMPDRDSLDCVTLWLCPGSHAVHYPVDGGKLLNIVASTAAGGLPQAFAGCCEELQAMLASPGSWGEWSADSREPASRWHDGRALLIGDAAHPALPYLAQGAAIALEDAAALPTGPEGFRQFESRRMARTARITRQAAAMAGVYHQRGLQRAARNLALRAMPEQWFLARLGWIYRGG